MPTGVDSFTCLFMPPLSVEGTSNIDVGRPYQGLSLMELMPDFEPSPALFSFCVQAADL